MNDGASARLPVETLRDALTVRRVFGDAYESAGTTVIPVASVLGGGGLGYGSGSPDTEATTADGGGGGLGVRARPLGVYVIRDGQVSWQPAMDLNRVILGGQLVGALALLVLARALRRRS